MFNINLLIKKDKTIFSHFYQLSILTGVGGVKPHVGEVDDQESPCDYSDHTVAVAGSCR